MTSRPETAAILTRIQGQLIVSCQASDGHPLRDTPTIARMAQAAVTGGAAAIRCGGYGGLADIRAVVAAVDVPVIGLTKDGTEGVYITPTVRAALDVIEAGAVVVAVDATARPRPDGNTFSDTVRAVHHAGALVMADVATLAEGIAAAAAGADLISTTLAGYTTPGPVPDGPDLQLVAALRKALPNAVIIAEGRVHSPQLAADAFASGASAVVVGTAITDPVWITRQYVRATRP
jgi:N-acylglucosamine-6-phosphate 2-epimerase